METVQSLDLIAYDEYDIYSTYDDNVFNSATSENLFQHPSRSSSKRKSGSALKSSSFQFSGDGNCGTLKRPITAVQGAGFVSRVSNNTFDPLNLASQMKTPRTEAVKEDLLVDRIRLAEKEIMRLINESCVAESKQNFKVALEKAKKASSKEHSLIRLLEQNGQDDAHNFELTYCVLFTVAHQYVTNKMYTEALNMYKAITKNRVFPNGIRLKINIGNIYAQMGMYHEALKVYRWVLDRIPSTNKEFRTKVLHNIGVVFIKMRKLDDACTNFEYVMQEKATMNAAYHTVLCHYFSGNLNMMKKSFQAMLNITLEISELQSKLLTEEVSDIQLEMLKSDDLSQIIQQIRLESEKDVITSANLIAPVIENSYTSGFSWCLEIIKNSTQFSYLSGHLEVNKAIAYLRHHNAAKVAIDTLKSFDIQENKVASSAHSNLAFIYFFIGNFELSQNEAVQGRECDMYSAVALVNLGNCYFAKGNYEKAKEFYNLALENDSSCIEGLYNSGLAHKKSGNLQEALQCFTKLQMIVNSFPDVLYQIAQVHEQLGDVDQAVDWYLQLLGTNYSDVGVLQKLADIFDTENDKQQAFHYYSEVHRYYPSNLLVLDWLGKYFIELRLSEKAIGYFEKASLVQPTEPKWKLLVGSCYRQAGNYQKAVQVYKKVLQHFPDNMDCLKLLIRIGRDLGLKETSEYVEKLATVERLIAQRSQYSGGSQRRGSGSRSSNRTNSSNLQSISSPSEGLKKSDYEYTDPLGPIIGRPKTSAFKDTNYDYEEFNDDDYDENLLPL